MHEHESEKIFLEYVSKYLLFSKDSKKKIAWMIKNHIRVGLIEEMKRLKQNHFMLNPYFQSLITLYIVDNQGKIPPDNDC
jgi:hypothetical protein